MSKPRPLLWSEPSAISRYAIAVLSVAIAIVVAGLLTVFLHTEPIASSMISAVMFVAWFGGFGPGLLAIALAVLAIHYYLVPPLNSFALKNNLFSLGVAELPRFILFSIAALFITFLSSAQRAAAESLRRSRDNLLAASEHQKQIEGALRHSEMYLAEAQRLSQTGSFGWDVSSGEIFWSKESFRIFGYEKAPSVTVDMVLQRVHPEDRALVQRTLPRLCRRRCLWRKRPWRQPRPSECCKARGKVRPRRRLMLRGQRSHLSPGGSKRDRRDKPRQALGQLHVPISGRPYGGQFR
jgi:PAS domain-containing protein